MNALLLVKRTAIGLGALATVVVAGGSLSERSARRRALHDFPAPGRMVDIGGGRRLQLDCRGSGSPTVVLEAGLDNYGSLSWAAVHDSLAATTRVCAYSRAGIMWSDPVDGPFDVEAQERDLHAALANAGERAPWVMVGHSLGGPYVMVFAGLYRSEVAGVVLVDATHPDQFPRYRRIAGKSMQPDGSDVRLGAALAWTGVIRLLPPAAMPGAPALVNQAGPAFLATSLGELSRETAAISATLRTAGAVRDLGDRPLVVMTAMRPTSPEVLRIMDVTPVVGAALRTATRALHEDASHWSTRGEHELVQDASHYIQFDRPDALIGAVRRVVARAR